MAEEVLHSAECSSLTHFEPDTGLCLVQFQVAEVVYPSFRTIDASVFVKSDNKCLETALFLIYVFLNSVLTL